MHSGWLRIGHRGASGSAPEHTASAFRKAVESGVDMVELDIQLSRDGKLVVMHDLILDRTTNSEGLVRERTIDQLKELDCGTWYGSSFAGECVLTLDEVIGIITPKVRLNVEIKALEQDWDQIAVALIDLLRRTDRIDSTVVSSFLFGALERVRHHSKEVPLGLLTHDPQLGGIWEWAERIRATSLHPHFSLVDSNLIGLAHQHGLRVIVWTVNDMEIARGLVAIGVDGIISDFPEAFETVT